MPRGGDTCSASGAWRFQQRRFEVEHIEEALEDGYRRDRLARGPSG
jgi:hypothetical protein